MARPEVHFLEAHELSPETRQRLLDGIKRYMGELTLKSNVFYGSAASRDIPVDTQTAGQPFYGYDYVRALRTQAEDKVDRWHIGAQVFTLTREENNPFPSATVTQSLSLREAGGEIVAWEYGVISYHGGYTKDEADARGFTPEQREVLLAAL